MLSQRDLIIPCSPFERLLTGASALDVPADQQCVATLPLRKGNRQCDFECEADRKGKISPPQAHSCCSELPTALLQSRFASGNRRSAGNHCGGLRQLAAAGAAPLPVHTLIGVVSRAFPEMMVGTDVTAITSERQVDGKLRGRGLWKMSLCDPGRHQPLAEPT
jgi:hypothetical protein